VTDRIASPFIRIALTSVIAALMACGGGASQQAGTDTVTLTSTSGFPHGLEVTMVRTAAAGQPVALTIRAFVAFGITFTAYRGTVTLTTDDTGASVPVPFKFTPADRGRKTVQVTLRTAGLHLVQATDENQATDTAFTIVSPAVLASLALDGVPTAKAAGEPFAMTVTARDAFGNTATGYRGTVRFSSSDAAAVLPADAAFSAADNGRKSFALSFRKQGAQTFTVRDTAVSGLTVTSAAVAVRSGAAARIQLSLSGTFKVDDPHTLTAQVRDAFGNAVTDFAGSISFASSDLAAPSIPNAVLRGSEGGVATVGNIRFYTAGLQSIVATSGAATGSIEQAISNASAQALVLSGAPSAVMAGEPFGLKVRAVDLHGNVAVDYAAPVSFNSTDLFARLPAPGPLSQGTRDVAVALAKAPAGSISVTDGSLSGSTGEITVEAGDAVAFALEGNVTQTAGAPADVTVVAYDGFANTATTFRAAVTFSSTDAKSVLPAAYTFTAADAGRHGFQVTFKTAGTQGLTVARGAASGSTSFTVSAAGAVSCALSQFPTSAPAGSQIPLRVTVYDLFDNVSTGFAGVVQLTSSDARAQLSPASAFDPASDRGSRVYSARLFSTGPQAVTAAESTNAFSCQATVTVDGGRARFVITLPVDVNAGADANGSVTVKDGFDNVITDYAGSVTFRSSDSLATKPPDVTFNGTHGGSATISARFISLGVQSLIASQIGDATITGSATTNVHGFVYADPPAGAKVRLVLNIANSTPAAVQLDLVVGNGLVAAYGAGFNLPLAGNRVVAGTPLLVEPAAVAGVTNFALGIAPKAVAAALPTSGPAAGTLLTGVSQKASGTGARTTDTTLTVGAVIYSVRLALAPTATTGTIFDGNALPAGYRAAVRDRLGKDVAEMADFAIGQLAVR
jgi:hypothetical protein